MKSPRSIHPLRRFLQPCSALALVAAFAAAACGNDDSESDGADAGSGSQRGEAGADSPEPEPEPMSGAVTCKSTLTVPAQEFAETEEIPNVCQQTELQNPLPEELGGADDSCDYLTGLSNANLFDVDFGVDREIIAGTCETEGCVQRCLKQLRPTENQSIVVLNQNSFDVMATLYEEADLAKFEKWCSDLSPAGTLQDCE